LFAVELEGSGEVQVVADLELAGLKQEEGGDQVRVAADDAELAAKLLFPVGHVTRTPSPSRCGSERYKPCRIMRMWAVPSIKFVFLKGLSLNSSSVRS
jgi:hypothetical protein